MRKKYVIILLIIILLIIFGFCLGNMFVNMKIIEKNENKVEEKRISKNYNSTKINEISEYIPKNINKINIINYLSDKNNPTTITIEDIGKIEEFMNLIFKTSWDEMNENQISSNFDGAFQQIIFVGDTENIMKMKGYGGPNAIYGIVNIQDKHYYISRGIYQEMVNFTLEKYYLHDSNLKLPSQEDCYKAQKIIFEGLTKEEKECVKKNIRDAHWIFEEKLVESVHSIKDSNSPYWKAFIVDEIFTDPFTGIKVENNTNFFTVYELITETINKLKNQDIKDDLQKATDTLKEGMDEHNLKKCFEAHKIIHDYDYFAINTPVHLETPPADWGGITTYFGKLSIIEKN